MRKTKFIYKDLLFRIVVSILGAHIIVMNNQEDSFLEAVLTPSYLIAFASSFLISMILCYIVKCVTQKLDHRFNWEKNPGIRCLTQILFGLLIPFFIAFLLASIYFRFHGYWITETTYLDSEIQIIFIMLLFLNLCYLAFYYYQRVQHLKKMIPNAETMIFPEAEETPPIDELNQAQLTPTIKNDREIFLIHTPTKSIPIRVDQIAYFYRVNGCNFLRTKNGEDYTITETLKSITEELGGEQFIRINRQMVISFDSCRSYAAGYKEGTLALTLDPTFGNSEDAADRSIVSVSEDRVGLFKQWINR